MVVELSELGASVRCRHPEAAEKTFKRGKLSCSACGLDWGNVQNNIPVAPFAGGEAALIKFANVCYPGFAQGELLAADLRRAIGTRTDTTITQEILQNAKAPSQTKEKKPCKFFLSGGCRAGASCKFSHTVEPVAQAGSSATHASDVPVRIPIVPQRSPTARAKAPIVPPPAQCSAPTPRGLCSHFARTGQCRYGANCKYLHEARVNTHAGGDDGGGGGGNGGGGGGGEQRPPANDPLRRFFDKCTKTRDFRFENRAQAIRFAEALEAYADDDLPWRLARRGEYGVQRMGQALQQGGVRAGS